MKEIIGIAIYRKEDYDQLEIDRLYEIMKPKPGNYERLLEKAGVKKEVENAKDTDYGSRISST